MSLRESQDRICTVTIRPDLDASGPSSHTIISSPTRGASGRSKVRLNLITARDDSRRTRNARIFTVVSPFLSCVAPAEGGGAGEGKQLNRSLIPIDRFRYLWRESTQLVESLFEIIKQWIGAVETRVAGRSESP